MFGGPLDLPRSGLGAVPIRSGPLGDNDRAVVLRVRLQVDRPVRTLCAHVRVLLTGFAESRTGAVQGQSSEIP